MNTAEFNKEVKEELIQTGQASKQLLDWIEQKIELAIDEKIGQLCVDGFLYTGDSDE